MVYAVKYWSDLKADNFSSLSSLFLYLCVRLVTCSDVPSLSVLRVWLQLPATLNRINGNKSKLV